MLQVLHKEALFQSPLQILLFNVPAFIGGVAERQNENEDGLRAITKHYESFGLWNPLFMQFKKSIYTPVA